MKKILLPKKRICFRRIWTLLFILMIVQVSAIEFAFGDQTQAEALQQKKITGTVKDNAGSPIPGATVMIKGTNKGAATDANGQFVLSNLNSDDMIVFSFIGMKSIEIKVGNQTTINAVLADESIGIEEVVAVGYGTQKKVTITGAVASVKSEEILATKSQNVQNMLTGKIPGVRVVQKTSEPGDFSNQFDIRGFGSPLIVIDGVPRDNISRLDPNEIESVSVLKDASAAIYGVRAANGVVLVTTKKGVKGRAKIEYTGFYGNQTAIGLPKPVGAIERFTLMNERGMHNVNSPTPAYNDNDFAPYLDGTKQNADWYNMVMNENAPQYQHNLSVSGSSSDAKIDYFINMGYVNQGGFWKSNDLNYDRYNLRSNINAQITERLKASVKLNGIMDEKNSPQDDAWTIFKALWRAQPNETFYANNNPDYLLKTVAEHPGAMSNADYTGYKKNSSKWIQSQFELEYKVPYIDGLKAKGMFSYDTRINDNTSYKKLYNLYNYNSADDTYTPFGYNSPEQLTRTYNTNPSSLLQFSLNYNRKFNKVHNVSALLLYEESTRSADNFYATRELGISMPYLFAGKALNQVANSNIDGIWKDSNKGFVGKFNYDYNGKYLAEFSYRYDGSSKFPKDKQWGFFPAASIGWRLSEENFVKNLIPASVLNNLKIRASYGKMGDDGASSYQYISGYDYPYNGSNQGLAGGFMFGGSFVNSLGFRNSPNSNITWYTVNIANIGLDADFWNGLLGFSLDVFQRDRDGLLANRLTSLPGTFGSIMPEENLNSDQNKGFEIALTHRNKIGELGYSIAGNISVTRTKNMYQERALSGNSYANWRNNRSYRYNDVWFGWGYEGQYQSYQDIVNSDVYVSRSTLPGDYIYEDWNNDGVIDDMDRYPIATTTNPTSEVQDKRNYPLMNFGLTIALNYKGFDLNLLFQGGGMSYVAYGQQLSAPLAWDGNALQTFMDRWHTADPKADPYNPNNKWISGYWANTGTSVDDNSMRAIQNGAYMRLKSAEIGYTLPKAWVNKMGIKGVRFFANGYNIFTITGVKGLDPEHPADLYGYMYPISRTINTGATITF